MADLSDTLTVGLVLLLLFGSIVIYLYTRIQQTEQKVSLLESILLDLKMSAEIQSYTELPADIAPVATKESDTYTPYHEDDTAGEVKVDMIPLEEGVHEEDVDQYKSAISEAITADELPDMTNDNTTLESPTPINAVNVNYESMSLKELQILAKSRGITGAGSMKKGPIIEALKTSDRSVKPGSLGMAGSNSFLETSATFSNESA